MKIPFSPPKVVNIKAVEKPSFILLNKCLPETSQAKLTPTIRRKMRGADKEEINMKKIESKMKFE